MSSRTIAQVAVKCAIRPRTAQTVEVAEQNKWGIAGDRSAPLGAGKQLCLNEAFAPAETEMRVDDVDLPEIGFNIPLQSPRHSPGRKTVVCLVTRFLGGS